MLPEVPKVCPWTPSFIRSPVQEMSIITCPFSEGNCLPLCRPLPRHTLHSLRRRRVGLPDHPALRGRLTQGSPTRSGTTASLPPPLPVRFPGVPSPGERSPRQVRANRCSGRHTRPAPRSQSAQYTSPSRRCCRPVRLRNYSRSSWPIRRGNVR